MVESSVLAESGFRTDGAKECLGNWGEAKLEADPCGPQNWAVDNMLGQRLTGGNPIVTPL